MRRAVAAAALAACAVIRTAPAQAQMETFSAEEIRAAQQDPDKYTLDEASVMVENLGPTVNPRGGPITPPALPAPPLPPAPGGRPALSDIGEIIRVGREIWQIVEANRPQVDVSNQCSSAVPRGIESWTDLEGWEAPRGTTYRLTAKNLHGMTMVDITYSVQRRTGGSYRDAQNRVRGNSSPA